MRTLIVVGNDKLGHLAIAQLQGCVHHDIVLDASSDWRRVASLLLKRRLSLGVVAQMAMADLMRQDAAITSMPIVNSNADLKRLIEQHHYQRIVLFRAGLIINRGLIESAKDITNIHCARLPDYAGLGAIARALKDGALEQAATLHRVTHKIDGGEILDCEPYQLKPSKSYRHNEDLAYTAGIRLLKRTVLAS
ncbi:MAG: formyltransferase family protein [Myxococcota bacterium]